MPKKMSSHGRKVAGSVRSEGHEAHPAPLPAASAGASRVARRDGDLQHGDDARFRLLVASVRDHALTMLDPEGHVMSWNPGAERISGYAAEEIIGQHVSALYPPEERTTGKPAQALAVAREEGHFEEEGWRLRKDGSRFWARVTISPARDKDGRLQGFAQVTHDVSEQRQAERHLRESEERFRLLVANVKDYAIFMLDPQGRIASWNQGAERIKGYRAEEIIGQHFSIFYPPEDVAQSKPPRELEIATREGRFEEEGWRVRKDGSRFWASVVITAVLDEQQRLRGFAKVTRDFTERRLARETELRLQSETAARQAAERVDAKLRDREERYRQKSAELEVILTGVADGITALTASGELLYANEASARASGYATAEAMREAYARGVLINRFEMFDEAGDPLPHSRLPSRRALAGEESPSELMRVRETATGKTWWSLVKAQPVRDATGNPYLAVTIARDVTEQRRAQATAAFLAEATAVLSTGLDYPSTLEKLANLAVPRLADWCAVDVMEGDTLQRVAVAHQDPAKVELARDFQRRYPTDPAAPHGVHHVIRTGTAELHEEITDQMLVDRTQDAEHLAMSRALGLKSALVVPLLARGRALGALTLVTAESGRHYDSADLALGWELGRRAGMAVDNARLYREATEAVRLRDEFLSIAGHELRTPLAAMMLQVSGILRLMQKGTTLDTERLLERLDKAAASGGRLERLIDELLDVSRITSHRLQLEKDPLDLRALAEEVAARLADTALRASAPIELAVGAPVRGSWDRLRLDQVLTNLLSNAIKYGAGHPVQVKVEGGGEQAVLTVKDGGIGIDPRAPATHLRALRARGVRAPLRGPGPGAVDHPPDRGGARRAHPGGERARGGRRLHRGAAVLTRADGRSILIVDDDPEIIESLVDVLSDEGYRVAAAHDGIEALDYLRRGPRPCLILLDWMMPNCDGPTFRRQQRAEPELADIPVVLLTADGKVGRKSSDLAAVAYLRKPVLLDELLRLVEKHCRCA
jgi:PAS domain S-box-containing protein